MNSKKKEHNWLLNKKIIENDFLCSRQDSNLGCGGPVFANFKMIEFEKGLK
jgi:hypothetical protein